ncbi:MULTISPECIES: hypothetical protein [unclassified Pseudactinotalea]|uniref:hypothetical protein n=1 Tax=Micrococcales TaxID=85006 RepID=UPI003C7DD1AA
MMAHLNAMKALIESERGFTVYIISVPKPNSIRYPYVLISPGYGRPGERPLNERLDSIDHDLQVRSVGTSPASALGLLGAVREVLSPGRGPRRLVVPDRKATVKFLRHEMTDQDRDVRVTATGQHPIFGVDAFHLLSTPQRAG